MTRFKEFDDADDFLNNAECSLLSAEAEALLDEIHELDMNESFGEWMYCKAGNYCDVDGYDYNEMILAFCRMKELT